MEKDEKQKNYGALLDFVESLACHSYSNPSRCVHFDAENRGLILKFLRDAQEHEDDIGGSALATVAQFLANLRINICKKANGRDWVTPIEIIEAQVEELRRCIVDLEEYRIRLTEGVKTQ